MIKTDSFYDFCQLIIDNHNQKFLNDSLLNNDKLINIHRLYKNKSDSPEPMGIHISFNYRTAGVINYGPPSRKKSKKIETVSGEFYITDNFNNFISNLVLNNYNTPIGEIKNY
jgi:hypothetical protein